MDIDIRRYIIDNFRGDDKSSIEKSINDSVKANEEETLIGMGVLFELLWKNGNKEIKSNILDILESSLK